MSSTPPKWTREVLSSDYGGVDGVPLLRRFLPSDRPLLRARCPSPPALPAPSTTRASDTCLVRGSGTPPRVQAGYSVRSTGLRPGTYRRPDGRVTGVVQTVVRPGEPRWWDPLTTTSTPLPCPPVPLRTGSAVPVVPTPRRYPAPTLLSRGTVLTSEEMVLRGSPGPD